MAISPFARNFRAAIRTVAPTKKRSQIFRMRSNFMLKTVLPRGSQYPSQSRSRLPTSKWPLSERLPRVTAEEIVRMLSRNGFTPLNTQKEPATLRRLLLCSSLDGGLGLGCELARCDYLGTANPPIYVSIG